MKTLAICVTSAICATSGLALALGCAAPGSRPAPERRPEASRLSLLVVGDTGREPTLTRWFHRQRAVGQAMVAEDRRDAADALLLLGDNFYWKGLQRHELLRRVRRNIVDPYCHFVELAGPRSERVAGACREPAADRHPVPIYAVLGDHDYDSPESPELQRRELPLYVSNWHVPDGLVEVVEFDAGLSLVLVDSVALRAGADAAPLSEALRASRGPWRVLALHHPLALARDGAAASVAYEARFHTRLRQRIRDAGVPVQLVLSGEEHNLQVIDLAPGAQVVSGAGSRVRELRTTNPATRFARAAPGFVRLDLMAAGSHGAAELVVSLFTTGSRPAWTRDARVPRLAARFGIDAAGALREHTSPRRDP